jgi:hypothetical protein
LQRFAKGGDGLFEPRRPALPPAERCERSAEVVLGRGPIGRQARAGPFLQRFAKGGDALFEPRRPALPLAERCERSAEVVLGRGPLDRHARAGKFVQNLAIKRDAFGQWFVLPGLLAVGCERISQAEPHPGQGFRIPDAFLTLNQRANLRNQRRELVGDKLSGLIEGEFGQAGLDEQAHNLLQIVPEFWRQRNGLGLRLILSGGFGARNVPRRSPIEPHPAFAAQAYDAPPDQNIGAGLPE